MMNGRMFDSAIQLFVLIGAVIGATLMGIVWLTVHYAPSFHEVICK